jgi:NTP pyrophosphatase (non-canonical NTP hydrolase)
MKHTYHQLETLVTDWAKARKIIPNAKPYTQLMKAVSEMGELCDAELKDDIDAVEDGVGDVVVCLINYCALKEIDLVSCLQGAYAEIKDRRGTMTEDGTFVKEAA